ncbi:MAG: hypothetical protein IPI67_07435 [Myxococcales bacterium]|nr:hypothetical protein [Myxococcales bacterium]
MTTADTRSVVTLRIEPDLCGPVSVGTVAVIRTLMSHLGLSLGEALAHVNHAVFDGEHVTIESPSREAAQACVSALSKLQTPAVVHAEVGRAARGARDHFPAR